MLGRYELVRPLARGGMAELFLARRRAAGGVEKRVVVKRIRRERAGDARFAEMFVREARLSMSLAHKNIVPVFDFGRAGDDLFLVMEYVEGVDLATALARARERGLALDPVLVAYVGLEACQALEYAHQVSDQDGVRQGVIHRDVTPANVLLSYSGEVKLLDFGIATSEAGEAAETRVRGTPPYMAPEQARGEALSAGTDVFAVGLVLWEALAGRRAYPGSDVRRILVAARRGEVPPLEPDVAPEPLRAIVERATRADPAERYPDAGAMQLALDAYLVDARAGVERRGPIHQLLAAWIRELFPERDAPAAPVDWGATVPLPAGPVATFLDDGEERVTRMAGPRELGTEGSIAATVADGDESGERPAEAAEAAPEPARDRPSSSARRRGRPRRGWLIASAALGLSGLAVFAVARDLAKRLAATDRPPHFAAVDPVPAPDRGRGPSRPPPTARPSGEDGTTSRPKTGAEEEPAAAPADGASAPRSAALAEGRREGAGGVRPRARPRAAHGAVGDGPSGTVRISSSPWAEVRVAGRGERCAETPCTIHLPPGQHTLTLRNPVAQLVKTVRVDVRPDEMVTVRETLTAPH